MLFARLLASAAIVGLSVASLPAHANSAMAPVGSTTILLAQADPAPDKGKAKAVRKNRENDRTNRSGDVRGADRSAEVQGLNQEKRDASTDRGKGKVAGTQGQAKAKGKGKESGQGNPVR